MSEAAPGNIPVISDASGTLAYTKSDGAKVIDSTLTITDGDDTNIDSATVILGGNVNTEDVLAFANTANITGSYNSTTGILTLTGPDTLANYETALESITYENTNVVNPNTANRTVTWLVNDGDTNSSGVNSTIIVSNTAVPAVDLDTGTGGVDYAFNFIKGAAATAIVDGTVDVTDADDTTLVNVTLDTGGVVDGAAEELTIGDLTFALNVADFTNAAATISGNAYTVDWVNAAGIATITLSSGEMTIAQSEAVLLATKYQHTDGSSPTAGIRTIDVRVNDGDTNSPVTTSTITVVISAVPAIDLDTGAGGTGYAFTFTEGDAATVIVDGTVDVTDADDTTLVNVTLTVGGVVDGALEELTIGNLTFALDAADFTNAAVTIGGNAHTVNWVNATGVATITLNSGEMTLAEAETVLLGTSYQHTDIDNPTAGIRTIDVKVNDGDTDSAAATSTITVAAQNDAPAMADAGATLGYTEGDGAQVIDNALTITDVDDNDMESATVSITAGFVTAEDVLTFADTANITGAYNTTNGVLTLTGTDTKANYELALESITYENTNGVNPNTGNRTVTWVTNDGTANSTGINSTITVSPLGAPVIAGAGGTLGYTEDDGAQVIDANLSVTDVDDTDLESAIVTITGGFVTAEDVLAFTNTAKITSTYNATTGVLTLTGTDTKANYEAALESITYTNSNNDDPNTGNRTITWITSDGTDNSAGVTSTITVAGLNDAPTATDLTSTSAYNEDDPSVAITDIVVADVDTAPAQTITATLTLSNVSGGSLTTSGAATYNGGTGIWTITDTIANVNAALAAVSFTPAANFDQDATITTHIEDQDTAGPADGLITLDVTSVNDSPTGSPVITGIFEEDATLGTDTSSIADTDGLGTFSYQWFRDGTIITGAIGDSYLTGDDDVGTALTVAVDYTDDGGILESVTSDPTPAIANINDDPVGDVIIVGDAIEDETLAADDSALTDDDGLGAFSYQWLRNGAPVAGATAANYTLTTDDVDEQISVEVGYTDDQGTDEQVTSASTATVLASNNAPTTTGLPDITVEEDSPDSVASITGAFDDPDGDIPTYTLGGVSDLSVFTSVTVDPAGTLTIEYAPGESGDSDITVTATDPEGEFVDTTFTVTVTPVVDLPEGTADVGSVDEDGTLSIGAAQGVLENDIPGDSDSLAVIQITGNSVTVGPGQVITGDNGGQFTVSADGAYTFDSSDFQSLSEGVQSATQVIYVAQDDDGNSITVPLRVTVTGTNDPVFPVSDSNSINAGDTLSVGAPAGLLSNDTDIDSDDILQIVSVQNGNRDSRSGPGHNWNWWRNFHHSSGRQLLL